MSDRSITPSIDVTIGGQTRLYHAFITSAPPALDAPSTLTLYVGRLNDISGFAADHFRFDAVKAAAPTRIVLVDTIELGWQRARYRAKAHCLAPTDPVLVGFNMLQRWLWRRLQSPMPAVLEPHRRPRLESQRKCRPERQPVRTECRRRTPFQSCSQGPEHGNE